MKDYLQNLKGFAAMRAVLQLPMFKEILPRVLEVPRRLAHNVASWFLV